MHKTRASLMLHVSPLYSWTHQVMLKAPLFFIRIFATLGSLCSDDDNQITI